MTKTFQAKHLISLVILALISGLILVLPFVSYIQKHSFLYLSLFILKIIALPIFAVSLISLVVLGFIKITQTLKLSARVFLILAFFLTLVILYIPLLFNFKPDIPGFDPLKHYTIHYANPLNTQINYVKIDYLSKEEIALEIQETSLKRYQSKLTYNKLEKVIAALNELKNKSRFSLVSCPLKFVTDFSFTKRPSYLDINGTSFYFNREKKYLFRFGLVFPRWCYNFPKLEDDPHELILDLVNKKLPH